MKKINEKQNIFNDNIGFVEQYDFSTANMNEENRIKAITTVASICYQNPKAIGSESLYNRLLAESKGLPSSSFEFVPVLIDGEKSEHHKLIETLRLTSNIYKYSEKIDDRYLLTNYRALIYEFENKTKELDESYGNRTPEEQKEFEAKLKELEILFLKFYNTPEECKIIKQHFKVFLYKVDLPTRSQMVRHRISWQELSRRYVSGSRIPFEFYISEKMKNVVTSNYFDQKIGDNIYRKELETEFDIEDLINISLTFYKEALKQGIKPQEARRIIPQAAYTQIWGAFQPKQLDNYFKLRLDEHAQWEIRQTAIAMQELIIDEGK